jgi:peptide deformylase
MAILPILKYPDPKLREVSQEVTVFDQKLAQLVEDLRETMYEARGVGIAAPQVGQSLRLVLVDLNASDEEQDRELLVLVNPKIVEHSGIMEFEEGCLSVVDLKAKVNRAKRVKVMAQDILGQPFGLELSGYNAVKVQHELDHLEGTLFIDHISHLKREAYNKKLKQAQKEEEEKAKEENQRLEEERLEQERLAQQTDGQTPNEGQNSAA